MNQYSHRGGKPERLSLKILQLWSRYGGAFPFRFAFSLAIVSAVLSVTIIGSLEPYRYVFVELKMNADQRGSARLFVNTGEGYKKTDVIKVRVEQGREPRTYRFRIPARDVLDLQLDPSNKAGRLEISDARVKDSRGRTVRQLDLEDFEFLEGPVQLNFVGGKLQIDIADVEKPSGRIRISSGIGLSELRDGIGGAILLWIAVVVAGAAAISCILRLTYLRRVTNVVFGVARRLEQAAVVRGWAIAVVVIWGATLGLLVIITVAINQNHFRENHPYFYDPVAYALRDIELSLDIKDQTRLQAAVTELTTNFRYPLRTVPLILTDSSLLAHPLGHLISGGIAFLALLILFGWTVFRRSGSLLYGLAATAMLAAMPWHFDCHLGLGVYWLDTVSAYFLLLAALALINWERTGKIGWVALFAGFASFCVLSRYVSIAYVLAVCGPLLLLSIWRQMRSGGNVRNSVALPLIVAGSILGVLAIPYLMGHFAKNLDYYSSFGYAIGSTPADTFDSMTRSLRDQYLGFPVLTVLSVVLVVHFFIASGTPLKETIARAAGSVWVFLSILLFQVFVIRTVEAVHQFSYVAILMVFTFISPLPWPDRVITNRRLVLSLLIFVSATVIGIGAARDNRELALNPPAQTKVLKEMDLELASMLIAEGPGVVWASFFDEYGPIPSIEAFFGGGVLPGSASQPVFSVHEKYFTSWYPGRSKEEVSDTVMNIVNAEVNIAVVPSDVHRIDTLFDNEYSKAVSLHLSKTLAVDPEWEEVYRSQTNKYGELVGYRNRRLRRSSGEQREPAAAIIE